MTQTWPAIPAAVSHVRRYTRIVLGEWGFSAQMNDAELVINELFTNAIQASTTNQIITLRLSLSTECLLILIEDDCPALPVRKDAEDDALSGRGLMIVEALSETCGVALSQTAGKIVWAKIAV